MSNKLLVVIGGPTGVGKTDMAIRLARHYQTEIICADSRQVYTELNIGVGRPTASQLNAIPHHLIGNISIHQDYSVAHYTNEALHILDELFLHHDMDCFCMGDGDGFRHVFPTSILSDLEIIDIKFCKKSEIEIGNFGYQERSDRLA